jgi:hypothetical protein
MTIRHQMRNLNPQSSVFVLLMTDRHHFFVSVLILFRVYYIVGLGLLTVTEGHSRTRRSVVGLGLLAVTEGHSRTRRSVVGLGLLETRIFNMKFLVSSETEVSASLATKTLITHTIAHTHTTLERSDGPSCQRVTGEREKARASEREREQRACVPEGACIYDD